MAGIPAQVRWLVTDPLNPTILYAGVRLGGVWRYDGVWHSISSGALATSTVWAIAVDQQNSNRIFAGADTGVYRTTDGGITWTQVLDKYIYSLAIDPRNSSIVYAGTRGDGIYRSYQGGSSGTWAKESGPPGNLSVYSLVIDNTCHILHAGTNSGVWQYGP